MIPSPQQLAFREALISSNISIILNSVAGSGKTTSLIGNLDVLHGDTAVMAFNKKIADEVKLRISRLDGMTQLKTQAGTAHSFGFGIYKDSGIKPRVEGGKVNFMLKDLLESRGLDWNHPLVKTKHVVRQLVSIAKQECFGCDGVVDLTGGKVKHRSIEDEMAWMQLIDHFNLEPEIGAVWEANIERGISEIISTAQTILKQSNNRRNQIDFDDMIYLPLLFNLEPKRKFANVLIDEAQDTNKARIDLAFKLLKPSGRLIAVGDPHQAIYGFTGASADALQIIQLRSAATELPLSVCWRCDEKIIREAQKQVPHIESHDTEGRGLVRDLPFGDDFIAELQPKDVILCRLNKPNVALAIELLRRGKNPRIEGRDIGQTLLKHARLAAPDGPELDELLLALDSYVQHQSLLLRNRERHTAAAYLEDEVDALRVLIYRCLEQGHRRQLDLEQLCDSLFADEANKLNCILLCSVHKSKGLEWPRVYILGRDDYMPFFRAEKAWELEQEQNLIYVAVTRAAHELVYVTGAQAAIDALAKKRMGTCTAE